MDTWRFLGCWRQDKEGQGRKEGQGWGDKWNRKCSSNQTREELAKNPNFSFDFSFSDWDTRQMSFPCKLYFQIFLNPHLYQNYLGNRSKKQHRHFERISTILITPSCQYVRNNIIYDTLNQSFYKKNIQCTKCFKILCFILKTFFSPLLYG